MLLKCGHLPQRGGGVALDTHCFTLLVYREIGLITDSRTYPEKYFPAAKSIDGKVTSDGNQWEVGV